MVPQQGSHGTFVAEFRHFARSDPALRPNDQEDFAGTGALPGVPLLKDGPEGADGVFMQDDSQVGRLHRSG